MVTKAFKQAKTYDILNNSKFDHLWTGNSSALALIGMKDKVTYEFKVNVCTKYEQKFQSLVKYCSTIMKMDSLLLS